MMNMMQAARKQAIDLISRACENTADAGIPPGVAWPEPTVEIPSLPAWGDLTTPFCLAAARRSGIPPRSLADALLRHIDLKDTYFTTVQAAGSGYLNFRLSDRWYADTLIALSSRGLIHRAVPLPDGMVSFVPVGADTPETLLRCRLLSRTFANLLARCDEIENGWPNHYVDFSEVAVAPCLLLYNGRSVDVSGPPRFLPMDALRFFLCADPAASVTVELDLAMREDGANPYYCVRYTRDRIGAVLHGLARRGFFVPSASDTDLSALSGGAERALIRHLARFDDTVLQAARTGHTGMLPDYLLQLADAVRAFYEKARLRNADDPVVPARLMLADAARRILCDGLSILGIVA